MCIPGFIHIGTLGIDWLCFCCHFSFDNFDPFDHHDVSSIALAHLLLQMPKGIP